MDQLTFAEAEYNAKKRKTRREKFLEQMDTLIPWKQLERKIQRHYPKNGQGRHPYPLNVMLRVHCMQLFYNLSDPAMEDSLYEIESMRRFAGLSLSGSIPDETTIGVFQASCRVHC
jgi:IS5 family transposase